MFGFSLGALTVGFAVGLVVGWNVLPQPKWVKRAFQNLFAD
jgi:hypothetical protein